MLVVLVLSIHHEFISSIDALASFHTCQILLHLDNLAGTGMFDTFQSCQYYRLPGSDPVRYRNFISGISLVVGTFWKMGVADTAV